MLLSPAATDFPNSEVAVPDDKKDELLNNLNEKIKQGETAGQIVKYIVTAAKAFL